MAALKASGADVVGFDDRAEKLTAPDTARYQDYPLADLDLLVLSPGVPLTHPTPHPIVTAAKALEVPICGDFDVFLGSRKQLPKHRLVGITGTNGKSTTTALIAHMAAKAGKPSLAFGNIGVPFLQPVPLDEGGVYVAELSSFQIDLSPNPLVDIAILLNLSPDHLDRHGTMENYAAAKGKLFGDTAPKLVSIISIDDPYCRAIAQRITRRIIPISTIGPIPGGVWVRDGMLIDGIGTNGMEVGHLGNLPALQGTHNWQNALAAYAAARQLGISRDRAFEGLATFGGLVHRQELLPDTGGVTVVNDSKATNWDSAARALSTFSHIRWIAGGRAKGSFDPIKADQLSGVKAAYLYGEAADALGLKINNQVTTKQFDRMTDAASAALHDAEDGDTVLLSPAATAFDQYPDFEARGRAFKAHVAGFFDTQSGGPA